MRGDTLGKTTSNPLREAVFAALRQAGFAKKADGWYRTVPEAILVVNLQKSSYGDDRYYLNLGAWLRGFGDVPFPKENQCHLRMRTDHVTSEGTDWDEELLNLENDIPADDRVRRLSAYIAETLVPFIREWETLAGIRHLYRAGKLQYAAIRAPLRAILDEV
jgi:hypothetical protein